MEASTPGQPGTTELEAALSRLETGVESMRSRVNDDLSSLRAEIDALNQQREDIDLTPFVERITAIINTVATIDVTTTTEPEPSPVGGTPGQPPVEEPPPGDDATEPPADEAPGEPDPAPEEAPVDPAPVDEAPPTEATPGEQQQPPAPDEEWPEGQGGTQG